MNGEGYWTLVWNRVPKHIQQNHREFTFACYKRIFSSHTIFLPSPFSRVKRVNEIELKKHWNKGAEVTKERDKHIRPFGKNSWTDFWKALVSLLLTGKHQRRKGKLDLRKCNGESAVSESRKFCSFLYAFSVFLISSFPCFIYLKKCTNSVLSVSLNLLANN